MSENDQSPSDKSPSDEGDDLGRPEHQEPSPTSADATVDHDPSATTPDAPTERPPSSFAPGSDASSTPPTGAPQESTAPIPRSGEAIAPIPAAVPVAPPTTSPPPMTPAEAATAGVDQRATVTIGRAWLIALVVALGISLIAAGWGWVAWSNEQRRADDLASDVDDLNAEVAELQERINDLEAGGGSGGLEDLFGGDTDLGDLGELGDLLGSLLDGADTGDLDELGDLFSGLLNGPDAGDLGDLGDLGDAFGNLFGEEGLGSIDLGDLFGDSSSQGESALGDTNLYGIGGVEAVLECTDYSTLGSSDIPSDDAAEQYDAVVAWVEAERGLDFDEVPVPSYVTFSEIDERIKAEYEDEYSPDTAELDSEMLAALGVVEPGTDMAELTSDFVGDGQVAGFYDPDTGELVVGTDHPEEPLRGTDLVALAHEIDHALTDQALGLPDDAVAAQDPDAWFAQSMLVEGDATLVMNDFTLAAMDFGELLGSIDPSDLAAQTEAEGVPHFLQRQLLFPYTQGLEFACALRSDGGWPTVNEAYDELPTTSAQAMWPERYFAGEAAADVPDLSAPSGRWDEVRTITFGAADLLFLFEAPGNETDAALDSPVDRARAWAGGELVQYRDGDESAVGIALTERDGEVPLCDSMTKWYTAAFPTSDNDTRGSRFSADGGGQAAVITCAGADVTIGIGPDIDTARAIAG